MPTEYRIRPIGRPKVERDTNGLRKITRRYVVDGIAVSASGDPNIEDDVFLPFGTIDREYTGITQTLGPGYTSGMTYDEDGLGSATVHAYLVEQMVSPAEEVTQAFLTRVYQELEPTPNPVQVGEDAIKLNDAGRLTIQRKFIVKNVFTNDGTSLEPDSALTPFQDHYDPERIGVDFITITVDGEDFKCFLGGVQSEEHEVYTIFTENYFEDAIISQTIEYRNGLKPDHRLEIRTIRAIAGSSELSRPDPSLGPGDGQWYMVSERDGSGSADFGAAGKPVSTRVWAKGLGIVSLQRQFKHNGDLEIVSIRSLGEQSMVADAGSSGNGAAFHHVSESKLESSGHQVFNDTYAAGEGRISVSTQTKGPIDVVRETWISVPGGSHSSDLDNITSESVSKRDGYDIHTLTGTTQESGIINLSRQYRHNGDLEIVRITKLGSAPTVEDCGIAGNGDPFVLIAEGKDDSGILTSYTATFAAGKGEIQTGVRNTGRIDVTSYTSLNTDFPADTYDHTTSDRDGYVLRTYKTYEVDSSFVSDKSKRWINKYVFTTSESKIETSAPALTPDDEDVSGSYSKQGPSALWSTVDAEIGVSGAGVISQNIKYVSNGNYFSIVKRVASASGTSAATYAPSNSVQIGEARSYERGWVLDTFTWAAISSSSVSMSTADTVAWTLPGIFKISSTGGARDRGGRISQSSPSRVSLPVVKTTQLSIGEPAIPDILPTPWAGLDANLPFKAKKDPYLASFTKHNWVYLLATTSIPQWTSFQGFKLTEGNFNVDLTGWTASQYNVAASDAYLSASTNIYFTDGTTTIYRLDTVRGSPLIDTAAV